MRQAFLASVSAIALIAGGTIALAQGQGGPGQGGMGQGGTGQDMQRPGAAQQPRPADQMSPNRTQSPAAQQRERMHQPDTTGQGSPQQRMDRMDDDRTRGAGEDRTRGREGPAARGDRDDRRDGARGRDGERGRDRVRDERRDDTRSGERAGDRDRPASSQAPDRQRGTTGQGAAGTSGAVNLTTEQRTRITTSIKQTNVRPVTNVNFNIAVGTVVPRTVELHPLPPTVIEVYPEWRPYRFVLVGDEIIIIEPDTYRIIAVIDA